MTCIVECSTIQRGDQRHEFKTSAVTCKATNTAEKGTHANASINCGHDPGWSSANVWQVLVLCAVCCVRDMSGPVHRSETTPSAGKLFRLKPLLTLLMRQTTNDHRVTPTWHDFIFKSSNCYPAAWSDLLRSIDRRLRACTASWLLLI